MDFSLYIIFSILAMIVGVVIGLMAQSGSVVIIPFLYSFFHMEMLRAMGSSLFIDLICTTTATIIYIYNREENKMDIKLGLILGFIALVVSFFASFLVFTLIRTESKIFPILLSGFQIIIGISLIRNATKTEEGDPNQPSATTKIMDWIDNLPKGVKFGSVVFLACIGGFNGGFFAGPGGFLMTVSLLVVYRYEIHKAVGTGLLYMMINALGPVIFYSLIAPSLFPTIITFSPETFITVRTNVFVDFNIVLLGGIFAVITALIASMQAQKLSEKMLKITLGIIVLILNSIMLVQAIILL
ncbi:MAG: TSUP family transporter [Candidatus Helarchaeota archaeon]